jgi:hypothetical protein
MSHRDWLVIALGLLIVALVIVVAAVCSVGALATPDDPPVPEIEPASMATLKATRRASSGEQAPAHQAGDA